MVRMAGRVVFRAPDKLEKTNVKSLTSATAGQLKPVGCALPAAGRHPKPVKRIESYPFA